MTGDGAKPPGLEDKQSDNKAAPHLVAEFDDAPDLTLEADDNDALIIDIDGFEGPLDLLLTLARSQKVDLTKISVLALAQQYLEFISEAKRLRLEIAADYLVMAAWLAFLKSKLLLPHEADDEEGPSADELAANLAFRLRRLEAMREAASMIMNRKRLGRDIFARGMPEGIRLIRTPQYKAQTYELLSAYAQQRQRMAVTTHIVQKRTAWSIKEARDRLERILGISLQWFPIDRFLEEFLALTDLHKTVLASTFSATLEMAREGEVELKQAAPFAPLYLRRRKEQ